MIFRKHHPLIKIANSSLVDLPSPVNISVNWNFGSLLGLVLVIQLISGIVLATRFSGHVDVSFDSVILLCQDSSYGWLLRLVHSTGASFFFLFLYLHIGRGLYYGSYTAPLVWNIGVMIYLILMGTAFLGYVLPWGQMSYWAATVITNLLSAIPYFGSFVVEWVWGGFSVSNPTLTRFFALHYLLPFVVLFLVVLHLFFLHLSGSSNPSGVSGAVYKVPFHLYFSVKDLFVYVLFLFLFLVFALKYGYVFMDAENFIPANSLVTPAHIQPEWYFLFAYAILRSIPNKLGGVVGLVAAVMVLFIFSCGSSSLFYASFHTSPVARFFFWSLISVFSLLTWLGSCPAESPYTEVSLVMTVLYFMILGILFIYPHMLGGNSKSAHLSMDASSKMGVFGIFIRPLIGGYTAFRIAKEGDLMSASEVLQVTHTLSSVKWYHKCCPCLFPRPVDSSMPGSSQLNPTFEGSPSSSLSSFESVDPSSFLAQQIKAMKDVGLF